MPSRPRIAVCVRGSSLAYAHAGFAYRAPPGLWRGIGPHLTSRQYDVLGLVAKGRANKAIAMELGIGLRTVKGHVSACVRCTRTTVPTRAAPPVAGSLVPPPLASRPRASPIARPTRKAPQFLPGLESVRNRKGTGLHTGLRARLPVYSG